MPGSDGIRVSECDVVPGASGTYQLSGHSIVFTEPGFAETSVQWTFDGTTLLLSDIDDPFCDQAMFEINPWVLVHPDQ